MIGIFLKVIPKIILHNSIYCSVKLQGMYLNIRLRLKRGRELRQEYSTKWGMRQAALGGQGLSIGGFLSGLGKSGGLTPPQSTQGSLEKGKGLILGKVKSDGVEAVIREEVDVAVRRTHPPR